MAEKSPPYNQYIFCSTLYIIFHCLSTSFVLFFDFLLHRQKITADTTMPKIHPAASTQISYTFGVLPGDKYCVVSSSRGTSKARNIVRKQYKRFLYKSREIIKELKNAKNKANSVK